MVLFELYSVSEALVRIYLAVTFAAASIITMTTQKLKEETMNRDMGFVTCV